jgi:hypothetical protein
MFSQIPVVHEKYVHGRDLNANNIRDVHASNNVVVMEENFRSTSKL